MRRTKQAGNALLCLLINLILNLEWSIPAWILLALHLWTGISLWWFVGGIGLWIGRVLAGMWLMGWARACGNIADPPKQNKNPYSVKNGDLTPKKASGSCANAGSGDACGNVGGKN